MTRFTLPRDLYHGKGSIEALKSLKGTKAFVVVGGGSMKRFGFLDKVVDYLKEAGLEVQLHSLDWNLLSTRSFNISMNLTKSLIFHPASGTMKVEL